MPVVDTAMPVVDTVVRPPTAADVETPFVDAEGETPVMDTGMQRRCVREQGYARKEMHYGRRIGGILVKSGVR